MGPLTLEMRPHGLKPSIEPAESDRLLAPPWVERYRGLAPLAPLRRAGQSCGRTRGDSERMDDRMELQAQSDAGATGAAASVWRPAPGRTGRVGARRDVLAAE